MTCFVLNDKFHERHAMGTIFVLYQQADYSFVLHITLSPTAKELPCDSTTTTSICFTIANCGNTVNHLTAKT